MKNKYKYTIVKLTQEQTSPKVIPKQKLQNQGQISNTKAKTQIRKQILILQTNCFTYPKPDQLLPKALGAHKAMLNLRPPSFSSGLLLQFVWYK